MLSADAGVDAAGSGVPVIATEVDAGVKPTGVARSFQAWSREALHAVSVTLAFSDVATGTVKVPADKAAAGPVLLATTTPLYQAGK